MLNIDKYVEFKEVETLNEKDFRELINNLFIGIKELKISHEIASQIWNNIYKDIFDRNEYCDSDIIELHVDYMKTIKKYKEQLPKEEAKNVESKVIEVKENKKTIKKDNFIMFINSNSLYNELIKLKKINNEIDINKLKFKNSYDKWEYSWSESKEVEKQKGNIYTFKATFSPSNYIYYKGYNWIDIIYTCRYIKTKDKLIIKSIDNVTIS